ncbi:MAG: OsmC family protein [Silvanigrellales bacterium]|nr:OsmC family protein [Silvanigrellales bacterium]
MTVVMRGRSTSSTGTEITHGPSAMTLKTSAPRDNGGDGNAFSPTDLCAAALGACATTIMGMFASKKGVSLEVEFEVRKDMETNPRRLGRLEVVYQLKTDCDEETFRGIVHAGQTCPVRLSLSDGVTVSEVYTRC